MTDVTNVTEETEELDGCMCEYLPEDLKDRINKLADQAGCFPHQVVTAALKLGLAMMNLHNEIYEAAKAKPVHGRMEQRRKRKGKLSGNGV